jgi:hypothetical protein
MPLDLARRVGVALDISSNTRIRQIDRALKEYVRLTPQSPTVPSAGNIDASQVISGSLADARIPESAVTQHQAALSLAATQLASGVLADARVQESNVTQHEEALLIDWMQLDSVPSTFAPADHITTGTWTPADNSGAGLSLTVNGASYIKHEKIVILRASVTYPATADTTQARISGFPFAADANHHNCQGFTTYSNCSAGVVCPRPFPSTSNCLMYLAPGGTACRNVDLSGRTLQFMLVYTTP